MIETKIDDLITALNANTEAMNKVLAAAPSLVTAAEPAPEKPKASRSKAKPAEPEAPAPDNVVPLVAETPEPADAPAEEPSVSPEPESPTVSGYTPTDIRDYVRDYQAHITKTGGNTASALDAVKTLRAEFGVASLNDLTLEQCGPFFTKVKAALPM